MSEGHTDEVRKICALVLERDRLLLEKDVKIKYYEDAIDKAENKIKEIEKARKKLADDTKIMMQQAEQLKAAEESIHLNQEMGLISLQNQQLLQNLFHKEHLGKKQEAENIQGTIDVIYEEGRAKLTKAPHYKQMEEAKVNYLKVDIELRKVEVEIRERKRKNAKKMELQKKIFYNFFIKLAEHYVTQQQMKELERLKRLELEGLRKLHALQEKQKMKHKLGAPSEKIIKNMNNMFFGSQEVQIEKHAEPVVADKQPAKDISHSVNEKLNMLLQDEPQEKVMEVPRKVVKIIEDKVLIPPQLEIPKFVTPQKRKTIDLCEKWQKMFRNERKNRSFTEVSPQSTQQSQLINDSVCELQKPSLEAEICEPMEETTQYQNTQQTCSLSQTAARNFTQGTELVSLEGDSQVGLSTSYSLAQSSQQSSFTDQIPMRKPIKSILNPAAEEMVTRHDKKQSLKSVRFNLQPNCSPPTKETKGIFSYSMFRNPFGAGNTQPVSNQSMDQTLNSNGSFNMSLPEPSVEQPNIEMDFEACETQSGYPNFVYSDEDNAFKTPKISTFEKDEGGGGFFSFGSKSSFPF